MLIIGHIFTRLIIGHIFTRLVIGHILQGLLLNIFLQGLLFDIFYKAYYWTYFYKAWYWTYFYEKLTSFMTLPPVQELSSCRYNIYEAKGRPLLNGSPFSLMQQNKHFKNKQKTCKNEIN